MTRHVWRTFVVLVGVLLLGFVVLDSVATVVANAQPAFIGTFDRHEAGVLTVKTITNRASIDGPIQLGDRVRLADGSLANRLRFTRDRPGERFIFVGTTKDGAPTRFVMTMAPAPKAPPTFWIYQIVRVALIFVALVIAIRRPNDAVARTLIGLFLALAAIIEDASPWLPLWVVLALLLVRGFCQIFAAYAALALAVSFPARSAGGVRRFLERANLPFGLIALVTIYASLSYLLFAALPAPVWLQTCGIVETVVYFVAIAIAFVIGGRGATGADRKRARWVSWTLAVGFSGSLIDLAMLVLHVPLGPLYDYVGLTLLAIPFGLGYAIVRHRVVDIGFVVNRALVFGGVSAIVVVAFMVLEWLLSSVFVRVSHITSTSLELGLALVLGFSLRTIHARVDAVVDDLFFRDRHEAERALTTFAGEVAYVTDPRVAISRAHDELVLRTGASEAAIYLVDRTAALRVDPGAMGAPDRIDVDDPALVRLRATRTFCELRKVPATRFAGDQAFPMRVRDLLTGAVVLGPKANGEAYAPDELGVVEMVALALGSALDLLQTSALKAEVARVLLDGASLDDLRETVDPVAWVRGVAPQPAGSVLGLVE
ncbi:MAG: hypothetical protein ABI186_01785 [Candidatus Elarobacter sp.]